MVYADNAATTKLDKDALAAMLPWLQDEYGNASQPYSFARKPKKALTDARATIAACIGAEPEEIYFTSGGTESDNWAIKGLIEPNDKHQTITSQIEHHAVLNACSALERLGYPVVYLPVDSQGVVLSDSLSKAITEKTKLVSVMMVNNEIGTIEPIKELATIAHTHNVLFHTDAVQAIGNVEIDVKDMGIDLLSMSAHKFYGPKGVGALYVKDGINFVPLQNGGHQENDKRAGTENVAGIVGLGKAIEIANYQMQDRNQKILELRNYFIDEIKNKIPYIKINGDLENRLPGNINISFLYTKGKDIVKLLAKHDICTSSGSACSSGLPQPSHVLLAMGLNEDIANSAVRITLGKENTKEEIDYTISILKIIVENLRTEA